MVLQVGLELAAPIHAIAVLDDVGAMRFIAETAHPNVVLERERLDALRTRIERCCPPETPTPACTYKPCPHPKSVTEPRPPTPDPQSM